MIRRFFVALSIGALGTYAIIERAFEGSYEYAFLADAFFIVGIIMFFTGLIMMTDATKIFTSFGYTFKTMFRRKPMSQSFYDYKLQKEQGEVGEETLGIPAMAVAILLMVASVIITTYII
jgi:hypothetical protein